MSKEAMFELASRLKLRFESAQGLLPVEQLWDLPLTGTRSIDAMAVAIHEQLQKTSTKSFVTTSASVDKESQLKLEILRHVIGVRVAERDVAAKEREKASKRKILREAIAEKTNSELTTGTVAELERKLAELED